MTAAALMLVWPTLAQAATPAPEPEPGLLEAAPMPAAAAPAPSPQPKPVKLREPPCLDAMRRLIAGARQAGDPGRLWETEGQLATLRARQACDASQVVAREKAPEIGTPRRIDAALILPRAASGPGVGPWILAGVAGGLAAGVVYLDLAAEDTRERLTQAQIDGRKADFNTARADLEQRQWIARGVAGGAALVAAGALTWWVLGGDDDPVQSRPIFTGRGFGWGGRF